MNNEYLYFKKYLIKNEENSKAFFIDNILDLSLLRFKPIKKAILFCKVLDFFSKKIIINDDFMVLRKGKSNFKTDIVFRKSNDHIYIEKNYYNRDILKKELNTLDSWKNKSNTVLVCEYKKNSEDSVLFEYQNLPSLKKLISYKKITLTETLELYKEIARELEYIYIQTNMNHGDLAPEHLFVKNKKYILIDFTDTMNVDKKYDSYILLKCILRVFNKKDVIKTYFSKDEIDRYNSIYSKKTNEKHNK